MQNIKELDKETAMLLSLCEAVKAICKYVACRIVIYDWISLTCKRQTIVNTHTVTISLRLAGGLHSYFPFCACCIFIAKNAPTSSPFDTCH